MLPLQASESVLPPPFPFLSWTPTSECSMPFHASVFRSELLFLFSLMTTWEVPDLQVAGR